MEEIKLKDNHVLRINYDEDAFITSGDINGDAIFLVYDHRDFQVNVKGFQPQEIHNYLTYPDKPFLEPEISTEDYEELYEEWEENKPKDFSDYWIWTVYAYIHSGVSLSLSRGSDRWYTSSTGYLLILKSEYPDWKNVAGHAEEFIALWNNYLSGNIYRYEIIKQEECGLCKHLHETVIDSCGGFIGQDAYDCGILGEIPSEFLTEEVSKLFVS